MSAQQIDEWQIDPDAVRAEWLQTLDSLIADVQAWSVAEGWTVTHRTVEIIEDALGKYEAPALTIETPSGAVWLEPIARFVMGAPGRVDLSAYPTMFRVMLLPNGEGGRWRIRTDSGIYIKKPWNAETFVDLALDLSGA